jgi:hypothetical protein
MAGPITLRSSKYLDFSTLTADLNTVELHMKIVAVHQPNYLPWLGFFEKLHRSDVFVVLDDAQLPKTGSSWTNRTRLLQSGTPRWLTIPVVRPTGLQRIDQARSDGNAWLGTHRSTIHDAYRDAPHYTQLESLLDEIYGTSNSDHLMTFNLRALETILRNLEVSSFEKIRLASTYQVDTRGTQRLVDLVQKVGGSVYLCGDGSSEYLDTNLMLQSDLGLVFQQFKERPRKHIRAQNFVAGLSILDSLLIEGPRATRSYFEASTST